MGSGILIKNTAGAAAVAVLLFLAAVPVLKLLVLMALYYAAAAAMQPVCDKRLVSCMSQTAAGHGMLLKIVGYSLALFAVYDRGFYAYRPTRRITRHDQKAGPKAVPALGICAGLGRIKWREFISGSEALYFI